MEQVPSSDDYVLAYNLINGNSGAASSVLKAFSLEHLKEAKLITNSFKTPFDFTGGRYTSGKEFKRFLKLLNRIIRTKMPYIEGDVLHPISNLGCKLIFEQATFETLDLARNSIYGKKLIRYCRMLARKSSPLFNMNLESSVGGLGAVYNYTTSRFDTLLVATFQFRHPEEGARNLNRYRAQTELDLNMYRIIFSIASVLKVIDSITRVCAEYAFERTTNTTAQ